MHAYILHGQPLSLLSLAWLGGLARRIILLVALICYVTLRGQKVSGDMSRSIWKARFWSMFSRIARYVELSLGELYDVGTASIEIWCWVPDGLVIVSQIDGFLPGCHSESSCLVRHIGRQCDIRQSQNRRPCWKLLKTVDRWPANPMWVCPKMGIHHLFYLIRGSDDQPWDLRMPYFCANPYAEVLHCLVMYSYWKWKCAWWWKLR